MFRKGLAPNPVRASPLLLGAEPSFWKKGREKCQLKTGKINIAAENGFFVLYGSFDRHIHKILYEKIAWKTKEVIEIDIMVNFVA